MDDLIRPRIPTGAPDSRRSHDPRWRAAAATIPLPRRMLGVWPHPDDETYLSAGLMGRVIDAGGSVAVVTATRGEKGTSDSTDYDQPHFGRRREVELRTALAEVGVDVLRFLGHRDGECDLVRPEAAIGAIAEAMQVVRPDVVVTFGPDGITGHPDHRVVSAWVTEAWRRVGCGELLYATMSDDFVEEFAGLHDELGIFDEFGLPGPASVPRSDLALSAALDEQEIDRKRRALAHHASQTAGLAELMGEDTYRRWVSREDFRRPTRAELSTCPVLGRVAALAGVGV